MTLTDFLQTINKNREFLGDVGEGTGCPLRIVMLTRCPKDVQHDELWYYDATDPIDPDPIRAARHLHLDQDFTRAVADGWDGYSPSCEGDPLLILSGYLIGTSIRPAPLQLTPGAQ